MPGPADGPHGPGHDGHHHDHDEVDPTGIRDLLAGLPAPGPMPDDLVRRIEARLEVERAAREQESSRSQGRHADRVVDLSGERGRRRSGRTLVWLGAAAAGLVATAAVVPQLVGGMGETVSSDTAAYYPSGRADAPDDAAGDAGGDAADVAGDGTGGDGGGDDAGFNIAGEEADRAASPDLGLVPADGELVLLGDLGQVEAERLTQALMQAIDEHDVGSTRPSGSSEVLTEREAASCWRGLADTHSFDRYAAAPAHALLPDGQREGEPVVALLGLDDDGSARSWIMPHGCTGQPDLAPIAEGEPHD